MKTNITSFRIYLPSTFYCLLFIVLQIGGVHKGLAQDYTKAPKIHWDCSVDRKNNSTASAVDWLTEMIQTSRGDFIACGFTDKSITIPSIARFSIRGDLLKELPVDFGDQNTYGFFSDIIETADQNYIVAVGYKYKAGVRNIAFAKFDKNNNLNILQQKLFLPPDATEAQVSTIVELPNGQGFALGGHGANSVSGKTNALIVKVDGNGDLTSSKFLSTTSEMSIGDMQITNVAGNNYNLVFTGQKTISKTTVYGYNSNGAPVSGVVQNNDIVVGIVNQTLIYLTNFPAFFNSTAIINAYPKTFTEYGPATPGKTYLTCYSQILDNAFVNNSNDGGAAIIRAGDGNLVIGAGLNNLFIPDNLSIADNIYLQNNNGGVECAGKYYDEYKDADAYLIKVNFTTGALMNGKHIGHFSGDDFHFSLKQEADGDLIALGTTADQNFPDGLPNVNKNDNFIIKADAGFSVKWRRHFLGQGTANCAFGLALCSDGGYAICGNNELNNDDYNVVKLHQDCQLYETYGTNDISSAVYNVTGIEPWSGTKKIHGQVVVNNGGTLTISSNAIIRFAYSRYNNDYFELYGANPYIGSIRVEKGGKLYIQTGAVLKGLNTCGSEEMWDGINTDGDPTVAQYPLNSQPYVSSTSATILNAINGVSADKLYWGYNQTLVSSSGTNTAGWLLRRASLYGTGTDGGARLNFTSTVFRNCRFATGFTKYDGFYNSSAFANCTFECTTPLVDEAYTDDYGRRLGTSQFVSMWAVQGVRFSGCQWRGNLNLDWDLRGLGITSFDANYNVYSGSATTKFLFKNLNIGIDAGGILGGLYNTINVHDDYTYGSGGDNFNNCRQSINLRNSGFDQIYGNEIINIPPSPTSNDAATGIFTADAKGFWIANNTLSSTNSNDSKWGTIINQSYIDGGEEYYNHFNGIHWNSQFEEDNQKLQARCNDYTSVYHAWEVTSGSLAQQGFPGVNAQKADNQFKDNCLGGGNYSDINSYGVTFDYYDKTGNPYYAAPPCVDPEVNLNIDPSNLTGIECSYSNPCTDCYPDLLASYNASRGLAERNKLIQYLLHQHPVDTLTSSFAGLDSVISILKIRNQQEDKRLLAATYTAKGDWTKALTWLNRCDSLGAANQNWKLYYKTLINAGRAGRDIYRLTTSEYNTIQTLANLKPYAVAYAAQSLLYQAKEQYYPLVPENMLLPKYAEQSDTDHKNDVVVKSYPNPFNSEITFEYNFSGDNVQLAITDIVGKAVFTTYILESYGTISWKPVNIPPGIYFYSFVSNNQLEATGKIIFVK